MNPHPTLAHELLAAKSERLRQGAATDRLLHELRGDTPHAGDLLLARIGDALVAAGSHLREHRAGAGAAPTPAAPQPLPVALARPEEAPVSELTFCFVRYDAPREASALPTLTWMVMGTSTLPGR